MQSSGRWWTDMSKMPEAMQDIVAEQLSAWLDDELPAAELELLYARLRQSPEQQQRLERYGLIGATLRGGVTAPDARQVGDRIRRVLDAEAGSAVVTDGPGIMPAGRVPDRRWQTNIAPFAAAATVLLTIFLMATVRSPSPAPVAAIQVNRTGMRVPVAMVAERLRSQPLATRTLLSRQRLTDYLVYHGEYTGTLAVQAADSRIVNDRGYAAAVRTRFEYPAK